MRDEEVWTDLQPAQSGNQPTRSDLAEHVTRAFARKFDVIRVLGPLFHLWDLFINFSLRNLNLPWLQT